MRKLVRRGFTLAEVLVTVTIIAVLAAVMVPAVINQVSKGDVPSVAQDFSAIQTAVTTFASDVRRFPMRLGQLGGTTLSGTAKDFVGSAFSNDSARYRGPYASLVSGHMGPTGAIFQDSLVHITGTDHNICMQDSVASSASLISPAQMIELASAIDHDTTTAGRTAGSVQWAQTTNGSGVTTVTAGSVKVCVATY